MNNRLIVTVADGFAAAGYTTHRFNFPYKEKGRKSPDAEPALIRAWQGAVYMQIVQKCLQWLDLFAK
jgi:predicted alpha/beta-hydrolase family hydrolase